MPVSMKVPDAFSSGMLKVGVRVSTNGDAATTLASEITGEITHIAGGAFTIKRDDGKVGGGYGGGWTIDTTNNRATITILSKSSGLTPGNFIMKILESYKKSKLTEPDKTLVDRGLMNVDGTATSDGRELLIELLFEEKKSKLKEVADSFPAEEKK